jgi:hypothetical protein
LDHRIWPDTAPPKNKETCYFYSGTSGLEWKGQSFAYSAGMFGPVRTLARNTHFQRDTLRISLWTVTVPAFR